MDNVEIAGRKFIRSLFFSFSFFFFFSLENRFEFIISILN